MGAGKAVRAGGDNGGMDAAALARLCARVPGADPDAVAAAQGRQAQLVKPAGSLGALEHEGERLAGVHRSCPPRALASPVVAVFAADHGVHARGVSPWPQQVTAAMVESLRVGGAAVSVLARRVGVEVLVVDVGVAGAVEPGPRVLARKVAPGTRDLSVGPAMTYAESTAALGVGAAVAGELVDAGHDCLLTGDMGITNTTASAALVAALTGGDPAEVTGRGTGIDDPTWRAKTELVAGAVGRLGSSEPMEVLAEVGGLEHAALTGFVLCGAAAGVPVLLDGVASGAAALVAQAMAPRVAEHCFAGHRSVEPAHGVALAALGLRPLLDLELRLGEGTGAVLAFPLLAAAGDVLREMATFASAGVPRA